MRGISVKAEIIDNFYKNDKGIASEDYSMYFNYLKVNLEELHRDYYGKELDPGLIKGCIGSIIKSYGFLSATEIRYCMRSIVDGIYTISKYGFNTSDLLAVLKQYAAQKNRVKSEFFAIKAEQEREQEDKIAADKFLREALVKMQQGDPLSIYERSAIGKHLADQLSDDLVTACREKAEQDLPDKLKELGRMRADLGEMFADPEMRIPLAWTESLLYGSYLFNVIKPNYE